MQMEIAVLGIALTAVALVAAAAIVKLNARLAKISEQLEMVQKLAADLQTRRGAAPASAKQKTSIWLAKTQAMQGGLDKTQQIVDDDEVASDDNADETITDLHANDQPAR